MKARHVSVRPARAAALLLLVVAMPALATAPAFTLERIGAYDVYASPGEGVALLARLSNKGTQTESFHLTAFPGNLSGAWHPVPSHARRLDPNANTTIDAFVLVPSTGGTSTVTLRACVPQNACRDALWRLSTPLVADVVVRPAYSSLEPITGIVNVTWLNGQPVANAAVRIQHQTTPVTLTAVEEFRTDAQGRVAFTLESPFSRVPGRHLVFVEARHADVPGGFDQASYTVGLG